MKRLCIFSIYDEEGIVDDYLRFYLESLSECVEELIIVINGEIQSTGLEILKKYSKRIHIRENRGFDAGAYKDVLENVLHHNEIEQYDELILSNDTCFGPFIPFVDIFKSMDGQNVDFWGLNYVNNNITNHIQSNFLVFRRKATGDVVDFFKALQYEEFQMLADVYAKFENGIFDYLVEKNYKFGYYAEASKVNVYRSPDYAIRDYNFPFMKKRCFSEKCYDEDNCIDALLYIAENYDYDIGYILNCVKRKYNLTYDLEKVSRSQLQTSKYLFPVSNISEAEIKSFWLPIAKCICMERVSWHGEYIGNIKMRLSICPDLYCLMKHIKKKKFMGIKLIS